MSNIHTIGDYNSSSMINNGGYTYAQVPQNDNDDYDDYVNNTRSGRRGHDRIGDNHSHTSQRDMFWSWNLPAQNPEWYHMILLFTCPWMIGNPCSPARRSDWKRLLFTFIFYATVIQIVFFIVELSFKGRGFASYRSNPSLGPPSSTLRELGAKYAPDIKYKYHIHRLIVPIFMHSGVIHILLNLWMQLVVGLDYERRWGFFRMACIYLLSGIGGNMLSCCLMPLTLSVGASGALMGVVGARVSDVSCRWSTIPESERILYTTNLIFFLFTNTITSFTFAMVDWASHIGGFLVGLLVGMIIFCVELKDRKLSLISALVGFLLLITFFVSTSLSLALAVVVPKP